ncbi:MAG: CAP domain-containing protein [Erysipelotrichaceae bacterium]|nr:CAP domain-containing protein [Erysipelotrichaceae bacterium]
MNRRRIVQRLCASALAFTLAIPQGVMAQEFVEAPVVENEVEFQNESNSQHLNMRDFLTWIINNPSYKENIKTQAKDAVDVLEDGVLGSYTDLSDPEDATAMKNVIKSITVLEECNRLRKNHGVDELEVSLELMVVAQKHLNKSDSEMGHSRAYHVGENLSWGSLYPFDGWYVEEKVMYEKYIKQGFSLADMENDPVKYKQVGHYLNVINPSYSRTGAAFELNGDSSYSGICAGQVFDFNRSVKPRSYNGSTMEVSAFKEMVNKFCEEKGYKPPTQGGSNQGGLNQGGIIEIIVLPEEYEGTMVGMQRLYNPNSGEHFYTANIDETLTLILSGWRYESLGWAAPVKSKTPVYRLYNKNAGDHHYTTNRQERDVLIAAGWKDEGIGWYSDDAHTRPLYRQYNPNAKSGSHNYTSDRDEHRFLVKNGWKDEGIAWYASL